MSTLLSFMNNDFSVNNTQKVIKIPLRMNQNSLCYFEYVSVKITSKCIVDFSYTLELYDQKVF